VVNAILTEPNSILEGARRTRRAVRDEILSFISFWIFWLGMRELDAWQLTSFMEEVEVMFSDSNFVVNSFSVVKKLTNMIILTENIASDSSPSFLIL
jgi:hypothetical protein